MKQHGIPNQKILQEQLDDYRLQNEKLHQLLQHLQRNLDHYQKAMIEQREQRSLTLEKQREEYKQTIHQLLLELDQANKKIITLETEYKSQNEEYQNLKNYFIQFEFQIQQLEQIQAQQEQVQAELRTEKQQLHERLAHKATALFTSEKAFALLQQEFYQLQQQHQQQQIKIAELQQAQLKLLTENAQLAAKIDCLQSNLTHV